MFIEGKVPMVDESVKARSVCGGSEKANISRSSARSSSVFGLAGGSFLDCGHRTETVPLILV